MLSHRHRLDSRWILIGSMSLLSTLAACHRPSAERAEIRIGILVDSTDRVSTVQAANLALAAGGLDVGGPCRVYEMMPKAHRPPPCGSSRGRVDLVGARQWLELHLLGP